MFSFIVCSQITLCFGVAFEFYGVSSTEAAVLVSVAWKPLLKPSSVQCEILLAVGKSVLQLLLSVLFCGLALGIVVGRRIVQYDSIHSGFSAVYCNPGNQVGL